MAPQEPAHTCPAKEQVYHSAAADLQHVLDPSPPSLPLAILTTPRRAGFSLPLPLPLTPLPGHNTDPARASPRHLGATADAAAAAEGEGEDTSPDRSAPNSLTLPGSRRLHLSRPSPGSHSPGSGGARSSSPTDTPSARGGSLGRSNETATARPIFLGSHQSTLRPISALKLPPAFTPVVNDSNSPPGGARHGCILGFGEAGGSGPKVVAVGMSQRAGESTDGAESLTARPRPPWIGSLGEIKMVDELEVEVCVLCGRERGRADVQVREFELIIPGSGPGGSGRGRGGAGLGEGEEGGEKEKERDAGGGYTFGEGSERGGLGLGRWMVCRDEASCDHAVDEQIGEEQGM